MLELISIIASLVLCVLIPIEVNKIRNGWVRPKFVGGRSKFLAAYRRQLKLLMWLGLVFGLLGFGTAAIETHPGEPIVKLFAALIWLVVAGISFTSLRTLEKVSDADPPAGTGA